MTEIEFKSLAHAGYNRIPLIAEAHADLDTPLSLYLKLAQTENNGTNSFLLESVEGGERFGRYSFIGLSAKTLIRSIGRRCEVVQDNEIIETVDENPFTFIENFQKRFNVASISGLPRFVGGLAGYFGYDLVRFIEPKLQGLAPMRDPLGMPDMQLILADEIAVIDNLAGKIYIIVHINPEQPEAYSNGKQRLRALQAKLLTQVSPPVTTASHQTKVQREFDKANFLEIVSQAKELIAAGELMQVQIGQRLIKPFRDSPISLYRALRSLNPSPYMYYYQFDQCHVVGTSPEILVRHEKIGEKKVVTLRPLAGTRPRGQTPQEDEKLACELLADQKEIAEHVMLIDLARNDLGKIAKVGKVRVVNQLQIEKYSHVQHIVSSIEAELEENINNFDILRATFPAGTLTGAPKVRALEVIDKFEPVKRGLYGGAVGYISFSGEMDLAIAIRTGIIKDGLLHVQASAGIVADSKPEAEWQETEIKARAVLRAAEYVQNGFD